MAVKTELPRDVPVNSPPNWLLLHRDRVGHTEWWALSCVHICVIVCERDRKRKTEAHIHTDRQRQRTHRKQNSVRLGRLSQEDCECVVMLSAMAFI